MEWLEVAASSVEDAKEIALDRLGVHESDAEFEVLTEGKTGLFGRVKENARVRARVSPAPVRPKHHRRQRGRRPRPIAGSSRRASESSRRKPKKGHGKGAQKSSTKPPVTPKTPQGGHKPKHGRSRKKAAKKTKKRTIDSDSRRVPKKHSGKDKNMTVSQDTGLSLNEQADLAESFVRGIAETVGISLTFIRHDLESNILRIEARGKNLGILVGRRGQTARAIDDLVRTVLQKSGGTTREGKIRMDIGGVQARRHAALTAFVSKVANEALQTSQAIRLEPMNRVERKVVHQAVSKINGVNSRSEGSEPRRYVVIELAS